jgi:(p)ppGpp synthase/HD superfamily hydrolase
VEEEHFRNAPQIMDTIRRSHMKILHVRTEDQKGGHYRFNRIEIQSTDRAKIDKLIVKLKRMKGVREVSYRLI